MVRLRPIRCRYYLIYRYCFAWTENYESRLGRTRLGFPKGTNQFVLADSTLAVFKITMKTCSKCHKEYPATMEFFYKDKGKLSSKCRACKKEYQKTYQIEHAHEQKEYKKRYREKNINHIKEHKKRYYKENIASLLGRYYERNYNITLDQYDKMFEEQGGVCAICGGVNPNGKRMAVDHNHKTGKVRGLLCDRCNLGLEFVEKDLYMAKALFYLGKHV